MLLEVPSPAQSLSSGFLVVPDPLSVIFGFQVSGGSVDVVSSSFDREMVLGSVSLDEVALPLLLELVVQDGNIAASVSDVGGEQLVYDGPAPSGLDDANVMLNGVNAVGVTPTGVTRFDSVAICEL